MDDFGGFDGGFDDGFDDGYGYDNGYDNGYVDEVVGMDMANDGMMQYQEGVLLT